MAEGDDRTRVLVYLGSGTKSGRRIPRGSEKRTPVEEDVYTIRIVVPLTFVLVYLSEHLWYSIERLPDVSHDQRANNGDDGSISFFRLLSSLCVRCLRFKQST